MFTHKSIPEVTKQATLLSAKIVRAACFLAVVAIATYVGVAAESNEATQKPSAHQQTATLAAGCFWSMEAMFKQLKGVESVVPGYAGGTQPNPSYEDVETGSTGYAESVNITFDPTVISYDELLRVLLTARDPTSLNSQGPDDGTQYQSVIFYRSAAQQKAAQQMIRVISTSHLWQAPIVTAVSPFTTFYPAESYHVNYYALHPDEPYCQYVIAPELAKFRAEFKDKLKS